MRIDNQSRDADGLEEDLSGHVEHERWFCDAKLNVPENVVLHVAKWNGRDGDHVVIPTALNRIITEERSG